LNGEEEKSTENERNRIKGKSEYARGGSDRSTRPTGGQRARKTRRVGSTITKTGKAVNGKQILSNQKQGHRVASAKNSQGPRKILKKKERLIGFGPKYKR